VRAAVRLRAPGDHVADGLGRGDFGEGEGQVAHVDGLHRRVAVTEDRRQRGQGQGREALDHRCARAHDDGRTHDREGKAALADEPLRFALGVGVGVVALVGEAHGDRADEDEVADPRPLGCREQPARAVHDDATDRVRVRLARDRGEVHDRGAALQGLAPHAGLEEVAVDRLVVCAGPCSIALVGRAAHQRAYGPAAPGQGLEESAPDVAAASGHEPGSVAHWM
jgi:hypothetical protein